MKLFSTKEYKTVTPTSYSCSWKDPSYFRILHWALAFKIICKPNVWIMPDTRKSSAQALLSSLLLVLLFQLLRMHNVCKWDLPVRHHHWRLPTIAAWPPGEEKCTDLQFFTCITNLRTNVFSCGLLTAGAFTTVRRWWLSFAACLASSAMRSLIETGGDVATPPEPFLWTTNNHPTVSETIINPIGNSLKKQKPCTLV